MKPNLPMRKSGRTIVPLLLFAFCFFSARPEVQAQVNLNYAANHAPIVMSGYNPSSTYTISGYRITAPDVYSPSNPHGGEGIYLSSCSNIIITNCIIGPTGIRGIYLEGCSNITITNCIFLDNAAGVIAWSSQNIKVNNNQFVNMQNDVPIGTWGSEGEYVQFRSCYGSGNEIKDNVGENILGFSNPVDAISLAGSYFSSPCVISGNKLRGGGPSQVGGGIILGDLGGGNAIVDNNTLVDPGQYGISIVGGNNYTVSNNKVFGRNQIFTNVGIGVMDGYSSGSCHTNTVTGNEVNYTGNWPMYSGTPYYNPFWTDYNCGSFPTVWSDNNFSSSITANILPERILAPFLVAYLKFDNDFNDYCGSALNGSSYGPTIVCDTYRKAANFTGGSDYISLPRSPWLKPSSQMVSVSAWIKPDATSNIQGFIRSQDSDGWDGGWRGAMNGTTAYFSLMTNNGRVSVSLGGIVANDWNFVSFTYDGNKMRGYLNGALVDSNVLAGYIHYNQTVNMVIGGTEGTYNFAGKMAEVKIYNGVVNAAEMAADYNANIGKFDGSGIAGTPTATYYANASSATILPYNEILPNSYGTAQAYLPDATSYLWEVVGGTASYFNTYSATTPNLVFSIDPYYYVTLKLSVSGCVLPSETYYTFSASPYAPLKVVYRPATGSISISESTDPKPNTGPATVRPGGLLLPPAGISGNYSVEIFNVLGQKLKSGVFKKGESYTLNIGNAASGIFFVKISDGKRIVYSKQFFKN